MTTPQWSVIDNGGIHRGIDDEALETALPYEKEDEIDGLHEKHVAASKGKLFVLGKDKKLRRTALGAGLLKDQERLNEAMGNFTRARRMKRTQATKSRILTGTKMYAVADGPSPQNLNPVRRNVKVSDVANTTNTFDVPAHVAFEIGSTQLVTVDENIPGTGVSTENERTMMFTTHGVVSLACDAQIRAAMRIGDRVYQGGMKTEFKTNLNKQTEILAVTNAQFVGSSYNFLGYYLGPCCSRPNGGILVRLDFDN